MTISSEYIDIIKVIAQKIHIPSIKEIITPIVDNASKLSNFAAIILEDNSAGIFYIALTNEIKRAILNLDSDDFRGKSPSELAKDFTSDDLYKRCLAMGSINAISQFFFRNVNFSFDYTTDSLGLLNINATDVVGMVGFFPPLVHHIEQMGNRLIIIEKKEHLIKQEKNWMVSLDPANLDECNKILITSTTVLNESIDDILKHCAKAERMSMIGPTTGFLPDPLFKRGIDVIGGTKVDNPQEFSINLRNNIRWGSTAQRYTIEKVKYPGYDILLKNIKTL